MPKVSTSRMVHETCAGWMTAPVVSASAGWGAIWKPPDWCVQLAGHRCGLVNTEVVARLALVALDGVKKRRDAVQPGPPWQRTQPPLDAVALGSPKSAAPRATDAASSVRRPR